MYVLEVSTCIATMVSVSNSDQFIRMVFGGLLDFQRRGVLCDTVLRAQGGEILAHSAVVAAASTKLKRELARVDSEPGTQHIVELPDFATAHVQRLLEYIYSGEAGHCATNDLSGVVALCETLEIPLPAAWSGQDVAACLDESILKAEAEFLGDSVAAADDADLSLVVDRLYKQKDHSLSATLPLDFTIPDGEGSFHRYSCSICGRHFKRLAALKLHEKNHVGESPARRKKLYGVVTQKASVIGDIQQSPSALDTAQLHMPFGASLNGGSSTKLVGPYKPRHRVCNICDAVFECSADLYAHRRREHTNREDFMYVCECCERRFQFPSTLIEHLSTHEDTICETCNCQFRTYCELYRHRLVHHAAARAAGQRLFICRVCGRAFPTKPELQQHRTSHLKCESCGRFFLKPSKLRRHAPSCGKRQEKKRAAEDMKKLLNEDDGSPEEGYLCTECGKTFEHKTSLISHKKAHVSDEFYENMYASTHYTCETCGRAFPKPSRLRRHAIGCAMRLAKQLNVKVEALENDDRSEYQPHEVTVDGFKCTDCGRLFEKLASLASHKKVHAPLEFRCNTCGKVFPKRYYLVTHERKHSNERPFACEHCGLCFKQPGQVQRHMLRRHSGGARPHMCDTCGRTFTVKSDLKDHERIHSGERAHMCDQCGRRFRTRGILRVHERQHTGVMPFSCAYCGRRFMQLSNKLKHEIIHTGAFPLHCEQCGRGFADTSALRRHELYHSGLRPHACDVCGRAFALKNSLKSHRLIHEKFREHICPVCQKAFVLRNGLVRHLKIHVRNRVGRPMLANVAVMPPTVPAEQKPAVSYDVAEDGDSADEVAYEPDVLHEMYIAENVVEVAVE